MTTSGGCQCGAVRFSVADGGLGQASICHCRMCQKAFGNYFAPLITAYLDKLAWTRGAPSYFQSSDAVRRGFCQACGTPLTYEVIGRRSIALALGAFDEPAAVPPTVQYSAATRYPFIEDLALLKVRSMQEKVGDISFQHPDHDTPNS